jgi:hypothetical protein
VPTATDDKATGNGGGKVIDWAAFRALWAGQRRDDSSAARSKSLWITAILWTAALVIVFITWNGASARADVALQVPYIVSGGITALLLTIMGSTVLFYGLAVSHRRATSSQDEASQTQAPATRRRGTGRTS